MFESVVVEMDITDYSPSELAAIAEMKKLMKELVNDLAVEYKDSAEYKDSLVPNPFSEIHIVIKSHRFSPGCGRQN